MKNEALPGTTKLPREEGTAEAEAEAEIKVSKL